MKLRRWSPRGRHTAAQGLILSEGNRRNPRAPEGSRPQTQISSEGSSSYSRVYRHREGGGEKRPARAVLRNKTGADWLELVYASWRLAAACPEGFAWHCLWRPKGTWPFSVFGAACADQGWWKAIAEDSKPTAAVRASLWWSLCFAQVDTSLSGQKRGLNLGWRDPTDTWRGVGGAQSPMEQKPRA